MENISLILSDLDGTLFRDDKSVSDFSKQIIKQAQEKGILFGICTARAKINAVKFLDGISPDVFISNGGGLASFRDEKIYNCEFSVEETQAIIKTVFDLYGEDMVITIDNEHGLYSNSKEELGDKFWTYCDFKSFNEPSMKICVKTLDEEKIKQIVKAVGEDKTDFLPFSDIPWYKISKKAAVKEKAIEALCKHLNILPSNIASFGDDFNDIGMLKLCGKGIAMQNAIKEVKEIADEVTLSNENDGVANWIKDNLL
ncbi:MAG: Cof-type HAD-IIB family hydrolase [Treponema sp.]|nr:Cof-type HAD-IIB family hydrolase [Treponema sp.]